jgi:hypothetical protein
MRTRARRRVWLTRLLVVLGATAASCLGSTAAFANAASPTESPMTAGSVLLNANGTVTVIASGTWIWQFGRETATTPGLAATVNHPCDQRTGVGWGVAWADPNDPGITETYSTRHGSPITATVHVGSKGTDPVNGDSSVTYNPHDPCGRFVQTNSPRPGDGYVTGTWESKHTYANQASLPTDVCVITYDLGFGRPPTPHRLNFDNNDNSVQWALFTKGSWDMSVTDDNCATLPPAVPAPPAPPPPAPPPVKVVSHTVPPAPKPVAVATKPSGALAFTGFGKIGQLVALLGIMLVALGCALYFLDVRKSDVRKAVSWLLGL